MGTTIDFIEYVCDQIVGVGEIRYKKMFGEYMVYVNGKPILLVCDNTVFVKILPCLDETMREADKGFPYDGANHHINSLQRPGLPVGHLRHVLVIYPADQAGRYINPVDIPHLVLEFVWPLP